ncbi:MAG: trypsin-like serine protease [Planctomycetota bacterium]
MNYEQFEARQLLATVGLPAGPVQTVSVHDVMIEYLANETDTSYLQQNGSDVRLVATEQNGHSTSSLFQQTVDGIPVHDAFVTVVNGKDAGSYDVYDRAESNLPSTSVANPMINGSFAEQIAASELSTARDYSLSSELVWFGSGIDAQLAWQVDTILDLPGAERSNADYETIIDADTGAVLEHGQPGEYVYQLLNNPESEHGVFPRIVINDTVGPAGSRAYAAPFDAVGALTLGCTGTLIAPDAFISARHCGVGVGDTVAFGDNSNSPDYVATVQSVSLPDGNGSLLDGGDVVLVRFTQPVPSNVATPMRFIDATNDLVGQVAATIGYGFNGVGSSGHGFSADGFRWGGENIIDVYGSPASASGSNIISTDFDDGSNGSNTIPSSSSSPLANEATTAPGDSGGPVLVQDQTGEWLIAGVLSGGTSSTSVYGDISWWTGTSIYRSQIEAWGGEFSDGNDALGNVILDASAYADGDTINVTVNDSNGMNPLNVTLTTTSGDSETITLSGAGGNQFTGSIALAEAGASANDGTLQGAGGDTITVEYMDPDDGNGGSQTVSDTATITIASGGGIIAGVDFGASGSTPANWLNVGGGSNTTFNDLGGEDGGTTTFDLQVQELGGGSWDDFAVTPAASTIPQHSNALGGIEGQIYTGGDSLRLTYSDLTPGANYEIYVMSAEGFFSSIQQQVTISGAGAPVSFAQNFNIDQLFINDQLGDSSRNLSEYAQIITADAGGQIVIDVDPIAGTDDVVLAGVAIAEVISNETNTIGEAGTVSFDDDWVTVNLNNTFADPVVVVGPISTAGGDPSKVRVRNVTANSFQVRVQEYNYRDGNHVVETAGYVVMERGTHELEDGTVIVAGSADIDHNWENVSFGSAFSSSPVVMSQQVTDNGSDATVTRQRNVSSSGFEYRLQEEEAADDTHLVETVDYIAIEQGAGTAGGAMYEAAATPDAVTHRNFTQNFASSFGSAPVFLAAMQTTDGLDTASIRYRTLGAGSSTFYVAEEKSANNEIAHTAEVVGYFALDAGAITGVTQSSRSLPASGDNLVNAVLDREFSELAGIGGVNEIRENGSTTENAIGLAGSFDISDQSDIDRVFADAADEDAAGFDLTELDILPV